MKMGIYHISRRENDRKNLRYELDNIPEYKVDFPEGNPLGPTFAGMTVFYNKSLIILIYGTSKTRSADQETTQ